MYKAAIFYPYVEGAEFNVDYYCNNHMPMVKKKLGDACTGIAVDVGIGGGGPDESPAYVAIGYILTDNLEKFQAAVAEAQPDFIADMPNYTTIEPIIQICEVKL